MNTTHSLLDLLASELGLSRLPLDEHGCAKLVFGESTEINFEYDAHEQRLHFYSVVGKVSPLDKTQVYEKLLHANLFGAQTAGHTLAVNPESGAILLTHTFLEEELTLSMLKTHLVSFLPVAQHWNEELSTTTASETESVSIFDLELMRV